MIPRLLAAFALLVALFASNAGAQFDFAPDADGERVQASLIADTTAVVPGKAFTVAVRLQMKEGWHVYWEFGGDSGAPPTIEWQLPEGFKAGAVQWPLPKRYVDEGDLLTYVHEGELALLYEITPPADLPPGEVTLKAAVRWLVCEKICVPGNGDVALSLPVAASAEPANAELFTTWRAQLPKSGAPPFQVAWDRRSDQFSISVSGIPADAKVEFFPRPASAEVKPGHAKISAPNEDGTRLIEVPITDGTGTPGMLWSGLLVTQLGDGPREGWMISAPSDGAAIAAGGIENFAPPQPPLTTQTLLIALGSAFLGGLLLNLMPCVLPVIALKIYSFIGQAGQEPRRVFHLGLAFCAGILVFFLALAVIVVAFASAGKTLNYGLQFQNPYVLAAIVGIVFVFALSLLGVFELNISSDAASKMGALAQREGLSGAFMHGLFTTLLGTACIGPLLGPVIAIAFLRPGMVTFLVLGVMALGMALPYLILTAKPAWMKFLPKPGVWMERLKQLMGFLMLAIALVLLWLLGLGRDANAIVFTCAFLLVLGLASWVRGSWPRGFVSWIVFLVLVIAGWRTLIHQRLDARSTPPAAAVDGHGWQPFTPERVQDAIARGQPVFIDFTASWCANCIVNELLVLDTDVVQAAFKAKKFLLLKADWSNGDPIITQWLHKFNRVGVPVYVIYNGKSPEPDVLPEILTKNLVLERLNAVE